MSPSENDLRRALRDGEDDGATGGVDVQRIMIAGERRRAQRRTRIGNGLAVGALVAVVASGGVLLANTGGTNDSSAGSAGGQAADGGAAAASSGAPGRPAAPRATSAPSVSTPGPACPTGFPQQLLPGGGGSGQFGSGGRLFAKPVATITVCAYGSGAKPTGRVRLPQALARRLVADLEAAGKQRPGCPIRPGPRTLRRYALLPVGTDGAPLRTVTVQLDSGDCPNEVTNGTAVRFLWTPPPGLDGIFAKLGAPASTAPGRIDGSPVRS